MTLSFSTKWLRQPDHAVERPLETIEDEATLAEIAIQVGNFVLTRAEDRETGYIRDHAVLSAYRLAEWLVWNWWRLRWEPRRGHGRQVPGWVGAHRMVNIGGGWLWPDITFMSDGTRMVVLSKPSRPAPSEPLQYIADQAAVIPAEGFESAVDDFMQQVLDRLQTWPLNEADLNSVWAELAAERADPDLVSYRRLEALLGHDPDEADPAVIKQILDDAAILGQGAMLEVAADRLVSAQELREKAKQVGFDAMPANAVQLRARPIPSNRENVPAWRVGVDTARRLREQERLSEVPISNTRLAELCGVEEKALTEFSDHGSTMAFALDDSNGRSGRVVLRAKWETGRRFELARLLGDRLLDNESERLYLATASYTYRQKMQRAFAGEFLCPIQPLREVLQGDLSDEAQEDAAQTFKVSPMTVATLLANNGDIDRDDLFDPDTRAA